MPKAPDGILTDDYRQYFSGGEISGKQRNRLRNKIRHTLADLGYVRRFWEEEDREYLFNPNSQANISREDLGDWLEELVAFAYLGMLETHGGRQGSIRGIQNGLMGGERQRILQVKNQLFEDLDVEVNIPEPNIRINSGENININSLRRKQERGEELDSDELDAVVQAAALGHPSFDKSERKLARLMLSDVTIERSED